MAYEDDPQASVGTKDEALLQEIRDNFDYYLREWEDIYEDGDQDIRCLTPGIGPWEKAERDQRKEFKRPIITPDELHQYLNQLINDVRQNKRSIQVNPGGNGATDKTAELREGIIRGIEYKSKAQQAYITAFENAASRSYGFFRISSRFISDSEFDQELVVRRIPNPNTVLMDPDCMEADCSDADGGFELNSLRIDAFKRKYPNAQIQSFTAEHMNTAKAWIREDHVQEAAYWKVKKRKRTLLLLGNPEIPDTLQKKFLDELKTAKLEGNLLLIEGMENIPVLRQRKVEERKVCQYVTNGIEILEVNEWRGKWIPLIPIFGKEMYVDDGDGSKRVLLSLTRLARDPFMLYCYYRSCQAEMVAMTPKIPYLGYEGQFDTSTDWEHINTIPLGYAEIKPMPDPLNPGQVLPLPRREVFEPPIQALELGAEAARRAIQAAMGITPLPTAAQRRNEKSKIALEFIENQQSQGSFHFIDNYDRGLEQAGRVLDDLIPYYYDTQGRTVAVRDKDDKYDTVQINVPEQMETHTNTGEHDVTISTGPSFQSQREEAGSFLDLLVSNIQALPLDPLVKSRLLALAIKMKNLGQFGDQMVDLLDPKGNADIPPQALQAIQSLQQQLEALNAHAANVEAEKKKLEDEKVGKVVDNEYKLAIETFKQQVEILKTEISTKAQKESERDQMYVEFLTLLTQLKHEAGLAESNLSHASAEAERDRQTAAEQADREREVKREGLASKLVNKLRGKGSEPAA